MEDSYSWVSPSLGPDERILWRGKPVRIRLFEAKDLYMIPFSLLWAGFAVYWEFSAIQSGAPFFFRLFGAFFVIVGLYITVGRFIYKAYFLKRTSYAVTNERILINRNGKIDVLSKTPSPHIRSPGGRTARERYGFIPPGRLMESGLFHGRTMTTIPSGSARSKTWIRCFA